MAAVKKGQKWSEKELDYLKEHYPFERAEDVGNALGRSVGSVMYQARENGIHKDPEALSKIRSISNSGANSGNFNGYRARSEGYILRYVPGHPYANSRGYVPEHRLVVEEHIGTVLPKEFVVHHINGVRDDNRIENLAVMTVGAHSAFHGRAGRNVPRAEKHYRYKNIDVAEMKKLREEGLTIEKICKRFGICKQTFYKRMRGDKQ